MKLQDYLKKYGNVSVDEQELNEVLGLKPKRWQPGYGEHYWYVDASEDVENYKWAGDELDLGILNYSGVYKTKGEAEFARDKQKFLLKMKRDFEDNTDEIDWENRSQDKCHLGYYYGDGKLRISFCNRYQTQGALYTTNYDWLKQYIEDNEDDIRKYVFEL